MTWLLVPATDRAILRRVLGRLDAIVGYPRTHSRSEPGVVCAPSSPLPTTIALATVLRHDLTGPAQLQGALAVRIKPDMRATLSRRVVETADGRKTLAAWITDRAWELRADLPDPPTLAANHWTLLAPRDGAAGSADGTPIPEGG
jgi:hypothetical protein